jgi:hypothetical protein
MRRAEGGAKNVGVFRVKKHDFTPENYIFCIHFFTLFIASKNSTSVLFSKPQTFPQFVLKHISQ